MPSHHNNPRLRILSGMPLIFNSLTALSFIARHHLERRITRLDCRGACNPPYSSRFDADINPNSRRKRDLCLPVMAAISDQCLRRHPSLEIRLR